MFQRELLTHSLTLREDTVVMIESLFDVIDAIGTALYNQLQTLINMQTKQKRQGIRSFLKRRTKIENEQHYGIGDMITVKDKDGKPMTVQLMR
uniref:Uncharacterized protein n=1 Tax=viral metagenome TaxID=1070528 RepID=A0A6M3ILA6_9ZZZZ